MGMDSRLPATDGVMRRYTKKRKAEERRVNSLIMGKDSNLSETQIKSLERWKDTFDNEVHGGGLTYKYEFMPILMNDTPLSLFSDPNIKSLGSHMNKVNEICWLLLRTFPILQFKPNSFGEAWSKRWEVLEDGFRIMVDEIENINGEQIGAIKALADNKFAFTPFTSIEDIGSL